MRNKKIAVLLKYFKGELNPFDASALECALQTGSKEIIVVAMAPYSVHEQLESLTRLGVKGVLISDLKYAGSDTQATSLVLATALKEINADLIFCGRQSVDGDTAQIPPMVAKRLGYDIVTNVIDFSGEDFFTRTGEKILPNDKTVITFEKCKTLRFPSIFSKIEYVEVWDNQTLKIESKKCGLIGSSTRVIKTYESTVGRRYCKFTEFENLSKIIETALAKDKKEQVEELSEKAEKIYYVGDLKSLSNKLAKETVEVDIGNKTPEEIADWLISRNAEIVVWQDTAKLKILASQVAVITGAGICADCISFHMENGQFVMTRPAQGGNVTADIISTAKMTFATVRTARKNSLDVIFSIGRGSMDNIDKVKELAKKYNAELCCSRVVADSGIMPYSTQVGLTGKSVNPKVYVAFGISGAVQHTCAIANAGTVIAINCDRSARIFDYSDYGIIKDLNEI